MKIVEVILLSLMFLSLIGMLLVYMYSIMIKPTIESYIESKIDGEPIMLMNEPTEFYIKYSDEEESVEVSEDVFYNRIEGKFKILGFEMQKGARSYVINRYENVWTLILL